MTEEFVFEKLKSKNGKADRDPARHRINLEEDGETLASLSYTYHSKPFPLYFIRGLDVNIDKRGEGKGRKVMDFAQKWLKKNGKAGVLIDIIGFDLENDPRAIGMYERGGWQQVPGIPTCYAYNIPKSGTIDQLSAFLTRFQARRLRNARK